MEAMIRIAQLHKSFDGYKALDGLDLVIKRGSVYGLVGVNGAGKTTTLKHLSGIYQQDAGTVTIADQPVYNNVAVKAMLGYIPDDLYFFPLYTLRMLRGFYKNMYRRWDDERYRTLTEAFGLDERRKVGRFSKGMQKQAAFILAMSIMPEVLLLDEPLDGLDPIARKMVMQHIFEDVAARQVTVLVSSHNLKELDTICDAIGILKGGKMSIERDLDDAKTDVFKIQAAFAKDAGAMSNEAIGLDILHREQQGSIHLWIVRGAEEEINARIAALEPLVYDRLPLTLEEIFVYENAYTPEAESKAGDGT